MRFLPLLLCALAAWPAQSARRSSPRSAPRDEAHAQRKTPSTTRSRTARSAFQRANPCPATHKTTGACPGYVVDHIQALKRGGADTPGNMQWQTTAAARAKDRIE